MLRRSLGIAAICGCTSVFACGQSQTASHAAVPALIRSFYAAEQAYDAPALAKLISRKYVEVSPAGEVDEHDRFLGFYTPDQKIEWPPMTLSDDEVRNFGNTVVDILKITYAMKAADGTSHSMEIRATFVAGLEDGQYKLLSAQYTGIRPVTPKK